MEPYTRVIPSDLFNEAKLLKCVGRLCLLIHDRMAPEGLTFEYEGDAFDILLTDEAYLIVSNIEFLFNGKTILFMTTYNSKSAYPLFLYADFCEIIVFDDAGKFTAEFIEFCNTIKPIKK